MKKAEVEAWLLSYAWTGDPEQQVANVACIMAQDGWKYVDARGEMFAAQAEVPGPDASAAAHEFALSALYECHDGPHQVTCPDYRK